MMGVQAYLKDIVTILCIVSLLSTGLMITLRSGMVSVQGEHCRLVLGNLSRLILTLVGGVLFLLMIQQVVGFPAGPHW